MKITPTLFIIKVFCFTPLLCLAQPNISGSWKGSITQNEGGYRSDYSFEMYFQQKGKKLTGRSYVYVDNIYAEMELTGEWIDNNHIVFKETKVTRARKTDNLDWCIKNGTLKLVKTDNKWRLEGGWAGTSSFGICIPGKIFLHKVIPRV